MAQAPEFKWQGKGPRVGVRVPAPDITPITKRLAELLLDSLGVIDQNGGNIET
jgi:hypothetical protein